MLLGGLATLFLALASPIEPFAALLLQVHMVQHLLLMMVAPPLFWLGAPLVPDVRGLPRAVRTYWVVPLLRSRTLRRSVRRLTHPVVALPLFVAATWLWHAPSVYETALRSTGWHYAAAPLFPRLGAPVLVSGRPAVSQPPALVALAAFPVPDPGRRAEHRPVGLADVLRPRALSALRADPSARGAVRAGRPVGGRRHHVGARLAGLSVAAVRDRDPAACPERARRIRNPVRPSADAAAAATSIDRAAGYQQPDPPFDTRGRFDLLRLPVLGRFLRWRHARFTMQLPLAVLAAS